MKRISIAVIEEVTRGNPSASGVDRAVFFVGKDLVIKDDGGGGANDREYQNYRRFIRRKPMSFQYDGETWRVRFPKTSRVNGYIVQERIHAPHAPEGYECDVCNSGGGWEHREDCPKGKFQIVVEDYLCNALNSCDMHGSNYCVDAETKTIYVVDMAD